LTTHEKMQQFILMRGDELIMPYLNKVDKEKAAQGKW